MIEARPFKGVDELYSLYTDAATETLSKRSAAGVLILINGQQHQLKKQLPEGDNHQAEFEAAIVGFEILLDLVTEPSTTTVMYYTDSQLVEQSLIKKYAKHYQPAVDRLLALQAKFQLVIVNWLPEKQNQGAHNLALQALHQTD